MAMPESGAISFANLQSTFTTSGAVSISSYNRGGGIIANHGVNINVPATDNNLSMSDFYGAAKNFKVTITSSANTPSGTQTDTGYRRGTAIDLGSVSGNLQIGFSKSNNAANGILTGFWERATYRPKEGITNYDLYFTVSSAANCATQTSWYSVTCGGQETLRTAFTSVGNNSWSIINDASSFTVNGDFVFKIDA